MNFSPWIICIKKPICLSLLISPHRKEMRETVFWSFFYRDWRRCTMSYPRMVKTISVGMWRTSPLNQHTLGLHTSNFCFSFETLYRINLEHLLFVFGLIFVWRPPLSFLFMRKLLEIWVEISCMLLLYW